MTKKNGRDNPKGLTAREVIEDIANFPLSKAPNRDKFGELSGNSYGEGYAAWRNQKFARDWLAANPKRH